MKLPEWYWRDRRDLVRRLHQMELEDEEVSGHLTDRVLSEGGDLLRGIVHDWVTRDVQAAKRKLANDEIRKRRRELERTADQKEAEARTNLVQPPLDADMFPGPDSTVLREDRKWLDEYDSQTDRYAARGKLLREVHEKLAASVGGDLMATRAQAKQAVRQQEATRRALART